MRPPVEELVDRLGIEVSDPSAIAQAFVHSSYYNENPRLAAGHNERLEFLGDAVVSLVVSGLLYRRHPDEDEGFLTARRAALVNREALAAVAVDLQLDRYLLLGRGEEEGGGSSRPSVLAAAFEALAGAVYLAAGVDRASEWLARLFEERLAASDAALAPKSAKSRLQEWSQRNQRLKPTYEIVATSGPPHEQRFTISASIGGRPIAVGEGSSRRRAEEQAAAAALQVLAAEPSDSTP
jgi:ribonuclease-3